MVASGQRVNSITLVSMQRKMLRRMQRSDLNCCTHTRTQLDKLRLDKKDTQAREATHKLLLFSSTHSVATRKTNDMHNRSGAVNRSVERLVSFPGCLWADIVVNKRELTLFGKVASLVVSEMSQDSGSAPELPSCSTDDVSHKATNTGSMDGVRDQIVMSGGRTATFAAKRT